MSNLFKEGLFNATRNTSDSPAYTESVHNYNIAKTSSVSVTGFRAAGAIGNMWDGVITTFYSEENAAGEGNTIEFKWTTKDKRNAKTILVYADNVLNEAAITATTTLEGSYDGTTWVVLATNVETAAGTFDFNLIANDKYYKQYKIKFVENSAQVAILRVYDIQILT